MHPTQIQPQQDIESVINVINANFKEVADKKYATTIMEDWIAPSFENSWVDYNVTTHNQCMYMKDSLGVVFIKGLAKNGSSATATIFTLPVGYRPLERTILTTFSNGAAARLNIEPTGEVAGSTGASTAWLGIDGISFRAEQ